MHTSFLSWILFLGALTIIGYGSYITVKDPAPKTLKENVNIIKMWITFFGILTILSIVSAFIWAYQLIS